MRDSRQKREERRQMDLTIDDLLQLAQEHGDEKGEDAELDDLQRMLREAWDMLTTRQQDKFIASDAVQQLLNVMLDTDDTKCSDKT